MRGEHHTQLVSGARFCAFDDLRAKLGFRMHYQQLALFENKPLNECESITDQLRSFQYQGAPTVSVERFGVPHFVNEFWTAKQRASHPLHEISYRACFKGQLPEFFIQRLTTTGDSVYDPFMGRGTTLVQAALMGRRPIGNDINPLSVFLTRPRLAPPKLDEIATRLRKIDWSFSDPLIEELLVFYHPDTLREIQALRRYLIERDREHMLDNTDDWIRMVALNRLTGHSPGFFSVYSLPPNQAVSVASQAKINAKRNQVPPRRDVPKLIERKSRDLLKAGGVASHPPGILLTGPAENTPTLRDGSIQLVVTSPPFLDVVNYAADNWLRCWFVGIDSQSIAIAMHRKPTEWSAFIGRVFAELERILASGGHVAFEVGEVRGGKVELETLVLDALRTTRLEAVGVMINHQEFTKTANCWGVSNNTKGTNTNRIVIARKL